MGLALCLLEPDLEHAHEVRRKLSGSSVNAEIPEAADLHQNLESGNFSHVILNTKITQDLGELIRSLEKNPKKPRIILIEGDAEKARSIMGNSLVAHVLPFPYSVREVLRCLEEEWGKKLLSYPKFQLARSVTIKLMEDVYTNGVTRENLVIAQKIADSLVTLIQKEPDFADFIRHSCDYDPPQYQHPFLVCVLSLMLCRELEWVTARTYSHVALGALLHDVGMTALPDQVLSVPPEALPEEGQKIYEEHPIKGMDILSRFPSVPAPVLQIVLQHHEANGKGFPHAVPATKIYPLAKVVALAERYARYLIREEVLPVPGLRLFVADRNEVLRHDPLLVKALIKSFIKEKKNETEG